jgi:hypothetical protein
LRLAPTASDSAFGPNAGRTFGFRRFQDDGGVGDCDISVQR